MKITRFFPIVFLITIVLVSFYLRSINLSKIPYPGESMDEYSFAWVGLSLIRTGIPIGISGITGYKNTDFRYINVDQVFRGSAKGNPFAINSPWFDHPPLLGLVAGGFAYLMGGRVFEDTQVNFIRKPMFFFGVISVCLLFYYTKKVFGIKEAIIASAIYATSPLAIISSRMVQAENLLIPLFLASLTATYLYLQKQQGALLYAAGILAGISLLVKLSGLAIVLSCTFLILYFYPGGIKKAVPSVLIFAVVSLAFLIFFISYGAAFDFGQFLSIFTSNSNRIYSIGPLAFFDLMTATKITASRYLTDGFVLAGWFSSFLLFVLPSEKKKHEMYILIPLVCYLVIFLLFGSEPYGWYRFPFIPFLFAAIARILMLSLRNPDLFLPAFLILLIPAGVSLSKIISIEKFQELAGIWRWGLAGLLFIYLFSYAKPKSKMVKILIPVTLICLFVLSIYLNLEYFRKITPQYWQNAT
ncbi:glycosyltransferase family 39 protein [Candidatus Daviesbacteria bacterium]|nr:glycosyltransferase family 39 protein [Candidatus Daviesbacteria bacterium]